MQDKKSSLIDEVKSLKDEVKKKWMTISTMRDKIKFTSGEIHISESLIQSLVSSLEKCTLISFRRH